MTSSQYFHCVLLLEEEDDLEVDQEPGDSPRACNFASQRKDLAQRDDGGQQHQHVGRPAAEAEPGRSRRSARRRRRRPATTSSGGPSLRWPMPSSNAPSAASVAMLICRRRSRYMGRDRD